MVAVAITQNIFQIRPDSPAAADLEPNSEFLKKLNAAPMPTDVRYASVVSRMDIPGGELFNGFMDYPEGSDGAVSLQSQRLSAAGVPNFTKLNYREFTISGLHLEEPTAARPAIFQFLDLKSETFPQR